MPNDVDYHVAIVLLALIAIQGCNRDSNQSAPPIRTGDHLSTHSDAQVCIFGRLDFHQKDGVYVVLEDDSRVFTNLKEVKVSSALGKQVKLDGRLKHVKESPPVKDGVAVAMRTGPYFFLEVESWEELDQHPSGR